MPVAKAHLEEAIKSKLEAEHVDVIDTSNGCGQSFEVVIVSKLFEGKPTLQRHRLVNEALKDEIAQIHAFTQKTYTPEQYASLKK
ncbi:bola protein [Fimicolochytrium jonesii]|uniref:bola protein n=1 Tax=Fimicolochytrium jonesii TaxID=1396493 RepID=UPI0022FDFAA5|nr:bola protein [Fimicolochytrium jonesii]KAI8817521.1 bola protein [Fimicolochytrium jonesii]